MTASEPDSSHRAQAEALWRRWLARTRRPKREPAAARVPSEVALPPEAWVHYRRFAWVVHEQRIVFLVLAFLLAACALVWALALDLRHKVPEVVRSAPSLKEVAAAFYGRPEISYDQIEFFLHGCLPLLCEMDDGGHPLLPLAQGFVSPEIYADAERALGKAAAEARDQAVTQVLTVTGLRNVVADETSGRAAAQVDGVLTVTLRRSEARFFPWRARVLLQANPVGRLNPYPFYLLRFEQRVGDQAETWDNSQDPEDFE